MNKISKLSISLSVIILLISGCNDKAENETDIKKETSVQTTEPKNIYGTTSTEAIVNKAPDGANMQANAPHIVTVLESVNSGGYTYIKADEGGHIYWVAGPQTTLKVGSSVSYIEQMVMKDFTSKSLNKTFDLLVFASTILPAKGTTVAPTKITMNKTQQAPNDAAHKSINNPVEQVVKVAKNANGYSVEELYTKKSELKDKTVKVNAQVVKVSKNIMGKDWIHLQDGSGSGATSDIIATSVNSTVKVGDIVTTNGIVKTDVNLGYGYNFSVMIEEAKFTSI